MSGDETLKRVEIDEAFAAMSHDQDSQEESRKLSEEFAVSDWEAFQQGEQLMMPE